jgi:hypothetical protein
LEGPSRIGNTELKKFLGTVDKSIVLLFSKIATQIQSERGEGRDEI